MREHLKKAEVSEIYGVTPIISRTFLPIFVAVPELLLSLRESYSKNDTSEGEIISKYTEGSLLVLDDLGAEKSTEWSINILYIIIDRRYRDEKKTIITSNLSLDELADKLDDRIASRIAGMCTVVPMGGADRRLIK
jgi:DNA replication protein DnaC